MLCIVLVLFIAGASYSIKVEEQKNVVFNNLNWESMLQGEWLVKFYAPWCPACRALDFDWIKLADWADESHKSLSVGSVDVQQETALNGRFMVTSLPTIYHVKDGVFRMYKSARSLSDFQEFIEDEAWKEIAPISSWNAPNSLLMGIVGKVFGASVQLKELHKTFNEDYNIPSWITLLLLGLIVITIGLVFGIVLVLLTDWLFPSNYSMTQAQHKKDDTVLPDDERDEIEENEKANVEHDFSVDNNSDDENNENDSLRQREVTNKIS